MAKLNMKDIEKKNSVPKFNTMEALSKVVDPTNLFILQHKAETTVIVGAKEASKTWLVKAWELYTMELDPMASTLGLKKYQTAAARILQANFMKMINYVFNTEIKDKDGNIIKPKFKAKYEWEPTVGVFRRLKDKKNKINNQHQFYGSFEGYNALAGLEPPNGGYFSSLHIEEPAELGDSDTVDPLIWKSQIKGIDDTVKRARATYAETNPHFPPLPFKKWITFNDWDEEHPVSKLVQKYLPREDFINFATGVDYNKVSNSVSDKIDGINAIPELVEFVNKHWDSIRESILKNHTQMKYVEKDDLGKRIDTLLVRKTKFSNVITREGVSEIVKEKREEVINDMRISLMTGNKNDLAVLFGLVDNSDTGIEKRFNFKDMKSVIVDTDEKLKEEGRKVMGFSVGWDHDANRGPYSTPCTLSAVAYNAGNSIEPRLEYRDWKVMLHPSVAIEGYGKGTADQSNTKIYHKQMIDITKKLKDKYVGGKRHLEHGISAIFDDDDGSYVYKMNEDLIDYGFEFVDALENKNGKIETGGFGTVSRDKMWELGIDLGDILIDERNKDIIKFLKEVPVEKTGTRSVKGKFGKRLKDAINSAEYAWWVFRMILLQMR